MCHDQFCPPNQIRRFVQAELAAGIIDLNGVDRGQLISYCRVFRAAKQDDGMPEQRAEFLPVYAAAIFLVARAAPITSPIYPA